VGYQQGLTRTFLLDTHVWLWTVEGVRDLGRRTARFIERWAEQDALRISPLSVFEIAALHASGRLHLSKSPEHWIALALENTGARLAPLPRQTDATLVTADRRILEYGKSAYGLAVHDARR